MFHRNFRSATSKQSSPTLAGETASKWRTGSFDETLDVVFWRVAKRFRFSQVRELVEDAFVRAGDFSDGDAACTDGGVVVDPSGVGADGFERLHVDEALVT